MKEELLEKLRKQLYEEERIIKENNDKYNRISELESNPIIQEYLELGAYKPRLEYDSRSREDIIKELYLRYYCLMDKSQSNQIYFYLGTYKYNYDTNYNDIMVNYNDAFADYRLYKDLENYSDCKIPLALSNVFEENHLVVNPRREINNRELTRARDEFFINAVNKDQEYAKNLILLKYKK